MPLSEGCIIRYTSKQLSFQQTTIKLKCVACCYSHTQVHIFNTPNVATHERIFLSYDNWEQSEKVEQDR